MSAKHFTLREATLLDQAGSFVGPLDVRVEAGRITAVGANLPAGDGASSTFRASGCFRACSIATTT